MIARYFILVRMQLACIGMDTGRLLEWIPSDCLHFVLIWQGCMCVATVKLFVSMQSGCIGVDMAILYHYGYVRI